MRLTEIKDITYNPVNKSAVYKELLNYVPCKAKEIKQNES